MKSISGRPSAGTLTERQIRIHESKSFIGLQNKRTIGTVHRLDNTLKFGELSSAGHAQHWTQQKHSTFWKWFVLRRTIWRFGK